MTNITITRRPDDPICLRVSIGGGRTINGYYCLYRGTRKETIEALEKILIALRNTPESEIEPDETIIGDS